jgi:hypothetical protein
MGSIIAVPGLGSHAIGAFKAKGGNNVWLRDFLPEDIPRARVLVYGYDTTITKGDAKHSIPHLAMAFLDSVKAFRDATEVTLHNRSAQALLLIHFRHVADQSSLSATASEAYSSKLYAHPTLSYSRQIKLTDIAGPIRSL